MNDPIHELFTYREASGKVETKETITPKITRMRAKRELIRKTKQETAKELIERLPENGEFFHIVSNGKFDYWAMIPIILEMAGMKNATFHGSTWTINRENTLERTSKMALQTLCNHTRMHHCHRAAPPKPPARPIPCLIRAKENPIECSTSGCTRRRGELERSLRSGTWFRRW